MLSIPPRAAGYPPIPPNEKERLAALYPYNILDTPPEPFFDRIAAMAARLFEVPIALVSLVDADRQWFKAKCGFDAAESPREISFCAHAMLENEIMVVLDATTDPRFQNNLLVTGQASLRFYAGAPLRTRDGFPLGTLCVIDRVVRPRPPQHLLETLRDLAFLLVEQLELRSFAASKSNSEERLQRRLARLKQSADLANQAQSDFLAQVAQDIRTPMNLILGMNALLLEGPLNDLQRQQLDTSHHSLSRLARLIDAVGDLSRLKAGHFVLDSAPFDLNELLRDCAAAFAADVRHAPLPLEIFVDLKTWPYWLGDAPRLRQVLLTLISNAAQAAPHGKIEVGVRPEHGGPGESGLRFEVSGAGLPAAQSAPAFEALLPADSEGWPEEGSGIDLAIAQSLVEKMSGKLWLAEPGPGAGFVFTAFLPRSTEQACAARPKPSPGTPLSPELPRIFP